jgi:uncharacterized protein (DUF1778 family)
MSEMIRQADSKGRVALPGFANATLIIERVSAAEYRVKKAKVIAEDDLVFHEESFPIVLSERDAIRFLDLLENPPEPTEAAKKAAQEFLKYYGSSLGD